uniref:Holliday junction regulator protein family C-terminal domain-containing protein n=1 Tax=Mus musculus TaxID=10090 RepID=Q497U3_MOUSE|nr:Unknown (protein for MGC:117858) [Mus musculus]
MESMGRQDRRLQQQLNESRSRFQTLMKRLIAKYNQPFKDNYDELKKEFNRLYQKYCLSPQRAKVTSCGRVSPMKAAAALPCQSEHLKRLNPDSPQQSSQKRSISPGCHRRVLQDSTPQTASTLVREPWLPTKRRKLSYPVACAHQAKSHNTSGASGWP